ncbi:MAG: extracellular solute-binding protein [Clostridiales bacterium]|nr:extracellular solute-binding protein [Clostridiales bacterium]
MALGVGRKAAALMVLVALFLVAGCASLGGAGNAAERPKSITLYAGQHKEVVEPLVKAFEEKTGITVRIRWGETGELPNQIAEEGARSPADVIWIEATPPLVGLKERGLLAPLPEDVLAAVPAPYRDPEGQWVSASLRLRAVVYNPDLVKEAEIPASILDLASPRWEGQVAYAPSGAFQGQIEAMVQSFGEEKTLEWLRWLKAHGEMYKNNTAITKAVNDGRVALGLINNYYFYIQKAELKDQLKARIYFYTNGDPGGQVLGAGVAVLKHAPNPEGAQAFVAFLLSEEGQKLMAQNSYEYPVREGVPANPALPPFSEVDPKNSDRFGPAYLTDYQRALKLLQEAGIS